MHSGQKRLCTVHNCVLIFLGSLVQVANLFRKTWCKAEQLPKQYKELIEKLKGLSHFSTPRVRDADLFHWMCWTECAVQWGLTWESK